MSLEASSATRFTQTQETEILHELYEHEEYIISATKLASICSFLEGIGVDKSECIEDLYAITALALREAEADYLEGFAVLASSKKRDLDVLIDYFSEDGFKAILSYMNSEECNAKLLSELVADLLEAMDYTRDARRVIVSLLPKLTCRQIKGLIVAMLLVPPGAGNIGE